MNTVDPSHPFHLKNDLSEVPALRDQFVRACVAASVAEEEMQGAMLVLTELLNNAVEHGCKCPTDTVEGWWRITDAEIEIQVTDPGEILTQDDFTNSAPTEFAESGRGAGLFLVQAIADEVDVKRAPAGGTTIRVVKRRAQGRAA
jgi:anti-sigma regulatory factor (Ser/Thr protein kinase)